MEFHRDILLKFYFFHNHLNIALLYESQNYCYYYSSILKRWPPHAQTYTLTLRKIGKRCFLDAKERDGEGEKNLDCTEDDEESEIIGRLRHRIAALYRSNERKGRFARYAWEVGGLERKEED